jgi:hypothetical protein
MRDMKKGDFIGISFASLALACRLASSISADFSFVLLGVFAFLGPAFAIQALALSWLFSQLSVGVAPTPSFADVGRYFVIACAVLSVFSRTAWRIISKGEGVSRLPLLTLLLGFGIAIHSVLFSEVPDISLLKAASWTLVMTTLLSAWGGLEESSKRRVEKNLFGGLIALMLVSLPLLPSGLGYLRNGHGFQGILWHPQAFGPTIALLAAWLGSKTFAESLPSWRLVWLFGCSLLLIVLSEARTAGLGLAFGLFCAAAIGKHIAARRWRDYLPGLRSRRVLFTIAVSIMISIVASPYLSSRLSAYLAKRGDSSNLVDVYDRSRGGKIDEMWSNIKKSPMRGIGFGIASDPSEMEVHRDPVFGIPTGASVEKGFVFMATWEELGFPGFMLVMMWIGLLVKRAARGGGMIALSVCLTAMAMNFGEAVLFSPSGMGMLTLILVAWSASNVRRPSSVARQR